MIEKGTISQEPFLGILKVLEEAEALNLVDWNAMNVATCLLYTSDAADDP